jgi:hypothetical protein
LAFVCVWCALLLTGSCFRRRPPGSGARRNDLPWRMLAAAALVLAVTAGATHLGARLSGFFAMFPVMSTVLVGFAHAGSGRGSAVSPAARHGRGYFGFSVFCVTLAMQLREGARRDGVRAGAGLRAGGAPGGAALAMAAPAGLARQNLLKSRNAIPILQQSVQPASVTSRGTRWLSPKKKPLAFKLK